ncbi:SusC/RagA family TonB-linked outer membrane protein [Flavobacterium sp. AG291]|uniref:SusC/RagA family TonB-linked outer membrane protein n=1 Tax=Flavobacterium sp. AG291 TaxID=2184000 RepID=UPI000E0CB8EE|nr:TonB-dependent receptor [Flavobacterium sp. AG291]RDI13252.1 TonB-linked SusC/RagA family outer membrane protein [Flavobacterium sp. AG291]
MKSKLFLIAFLLISTFGFAQNMEVSGKVNEVATGLPMPGVNVTVKNSTVGTVTDMDGNYTISAPKGAVLVFSFVGFKSLEATVTGPNVTVSLQEDAKTLEEVVVIGYGTQKKKEVTGAVGFVDSKTIDQLKPVKVEQALQGTVSGVNVTTTSGAPGANLSIRIRGIGTNGNNDPAVIIDGYLGDINLLNPNDIESITVLKDAQAAIYGTIAANGIILVTTKKGRKNSKTTFSFNTYTGFQETSKKMNLLNATEYALLQNERYANGGKALPFPDVSGIGVGTDWQDEVFNKGVPLVNHDLTISGGGEKITYSVSGSHLDQEGIIGGNKSSFERNTGRLSLTADLTDKLKLNTNATYTSFDRKNLNENVLGSVLFNAINTPSIYTPYDSNGDLTVLPSGGAAPGSNLGIEIINPLAQIENTYNYYNLKKLNGTIGLDYELIKDLVVTGRVGFNTQNARQKVFNKMVSYGGKVFDNPRSSVNQNAFQDNNYSFDLYANYKKSFAEAHNFTFTLGMTAYKEWGEGLYATGFDVPNNDIRNADISLTTGFSESKTASSYKYDNRRLSHFARLQYDYKGRYLLSGMIRRDLSTRFGPGNQVAYFPSVTGGWILSNESFYKQSKAVSFAKLRASYGSLGNDVGFGDNKYIGLLDGEASYIFDGQLVQGTAIGGLANPNIKWEEARKFDVGADLRFINDKLEFTADYFIDTRKDLIIPGIPVSGIIGTYGPGGQNPAINAGKVENKGLELALTYSDKIGDDFSFRTSYNVTFLKNEVLEVNNGTGYLEGGGFGVGQPAMTRMEVGMPLGYFYGYKTAGIFQNQAEVDAHADQTGVNGSAPAPGDIRFVDMNGDGIVDVRDKTKVGDPIPDATMGFNIQLNYKGFDFAAYAFASLGNDMVRNYERDAADVNRSNYLLGRWHGEGTSNSVPRVTTGNTANNVFSDYFVEDASYCRIQNIQLGYTINNNFTQKSGITKLRLYVGANNLYTFTKYRGYDPGASSGAPLSSGIDFGFYPVPRTYLLGLNLNF